jgi:formate dehydrogenase subunit gamma
LDNDMQETGVTTQESAPPDPALMGRVRAMVAQYRTLPGGLLPLLHAVQDELGHVPAAAVPVIAQGLNLSRAEVHGVISYYHHFRSQPAGRHRVQICRAEACQSRGAEALLARAEEVLGCKLHQTRADGAVTLDPVYCLGLCALSPAIMVGEEPHARMTVEKLERLAAQWEPAS